MRQFCFSQTTQIVDERNGATIYTYWPTGEVKTIRGAQGYPVDYGYTAQGRMATLTTSPGQANEAVTTWHYDDQRGWPEFKEYDDGKGTTYTYTPGGRLATRTWARLVAGQPLVTSYAYNAAGDLADSGSELAIEYTDTTVDVSITRDRLGQISQITDAAGTHTLTYHPNGERETEAHTAGVLEGWSVTRGSDGLNRRNGLTLKEDSTVKNAVSYGYDSASGRLTTVTQGDLLATYAYVDESNLLESTTFTTDNVQTLETSREYDKLNRLTRINNAWPGNGTEPPGNAEFNYDVDNLNQRRKITLEDGSYWIYTYDSKGQVTSGKKYFSDGRVMAGQQFEYEYDEIGNRVKTREGHDSTGFNARETTWTANKLNQYESRTVPNKVDLRGTVNENATVLVDGQPAATQAIPSPDGDLKYWHGTATLDNASAPAQKDVKVTAGLPEAGPGNEDLFDQGSKQVTLPKHPEEFTYDDDGNLIQDGLRLYAWDAENRLIGVEPIPAAKWQGAQRAIYTYDAYWRRMRKEISEWDNTNSTWTGIKDLRHVWDGWLLIAEIDGQEGTPNIARTWTWGLDISQSLYGAGGIAGLLWCELLLSNQAHAIAYDGNGNVIATIAAGGVDQSTQTCKYDYGSSFEILKSTGIVATDNAFRFSTKFQDDKNENGGMVYYGYRFLMDTGKWASNDPLEEYSFRRIVPGEISIFAKAVDVSEESIDFVFNQGAHPNASNFTGAENMFLANNVINRFDYFGLAYDSCVLLRSKCEAYEYRFFNNLYVWPQRLEVLKVCIERKCFWRCYCANKNPCYKIPCKDGKCHLINSHGVEELLFTTTRDYKVRPGIYGVHPRSCPKTWGNAMLRGHCP